MEDKQIRYDKAQKIGIQISKIRKEKGYTREILSEKSNISPNYLYNIETGNKIPNVVIFLDICTALNVTSGEILGEYVDDKLLSFLENISANFNKLTEKEIKSIENTINFLAQN